MKKIYLFLILLFPFSLGQSFFVDVSPESSFAEAVHWAQNEKIVHGYADGMFRPNDLINRAEVATILGRVDFRVIEDLPIYDPDAPFWEDGMCMYIMSGCDEDIENCFPANDVLLDAWYAGAVCSAYSQELMTFTDLYFFPDRGLTYAEVWESLQKLIDRYPDELFDAVLSDWDKNTAIDTIRSNNSLMTRGDILVIVQALFQKPFLVLEESRIKNDKIEDSHQDQILKEVFGDLDNDEISERMVVYQTSQESEFGFLRKLVIYKKIDGVDTSWFESSTVILPSGAGGMRDPFEDIYIQNGGLTIAHLGGSSDRWSYIHTYFFTEEAFKLRSATIEKGESCVSIENIQYDLITGEVQYEKSTGDLCEENDSHTNLFISEKAIQKQAELPDMREFISGENDLKIENLPYPIQY